MINYTMRKILLAIPTLIVVATLTFLVVRIAPGNPATAALGEFATEPAIRAFNEKMGLNDPIWVQYARYMRGLFTGDLGQSLIQRKPISGMVATAMPHSLLFVFLGIGIGVVGGVPLGLLCAVKRNSSLDQIVRVLSLSGLSIPAFYLGILLILLFSVQLDLFPAIGAGELSSFSSTLYHLFLPSLTLGLVMMAYTVRLTRSSALEVLREDYVQTARAKGLKEVNVNLKHVLKSVLVPIVSLVGVYTIVMLGSMVMVEIVFSRPGLGKLVVGAVKSRDYNLLQSLMVVFGMITVTVNLLTDLAYGFIDPRIRFE